MKKNALRTESDEGKMENGNGNDLWFYFCRYNFDVCSAQTFRASMSLLILQMYFSIEVNIALSRAGDWVMLCGTQLVNHLRMIKMWTHRKIAIWKFERYGNESILHLVVDFVGIWNYFGIICTKWVYFRFFDWHAIQLLNTRYANMIFFVIFCFIFVIFSFIFLRFFRFASFSFFLLSSFNFPFSYLEQRKIPIANGRVGWLDFQGPLHWNSNFTFSLL